MRPSRDRTSAVYDKRRSLINYLKLDDENENKATMIKRITGDDTTLDISTFMEENQNEYNHQFPKPPQFSETKKSYLNSNTTSKIAIHERATIINSFDKYDVIDSELSFVNLENYLSKFDEDELTQLKTKDLLTFDQREFEKIVKKLEEFREIGKKFNDEELNNFFNEKIKCVEENKQNIKLILNNLEKVEEFIILDEILKFFFKKMRK
jgi:hypothetical protein